VTFTGPSLVFKWLIFKLHIPLQLYRAGSDAGSRPWTLRFYDKFPETCRKTRIFWLLCFAGRGSKFFQHFNGKLADLVLHVGYLEEVEVLKCVDQCREGLLVTPDGAGNGSVAQTPQVRVETVSQPLGVYCNRYISYV